MSEQKEHITINKGKDIPIAKGLPFIGQSLKVLKDPLLLLKELALQYEDVVRVRLGLKDFYLLQTPVAAKQVLQENARNYYKPGAAKLMKKVLGNGLATSNGEAWLRQRRLMQPAFHKQHLDHFFQILQQEISKLIEKWEAKNSDEPVDVSKDFLHLTLNNLTRTMFGTGVEAQMNEIAQVLRTMLDFSSENVKALIKIPLFIPTKSNLRFQAAEERFEKIIYLFIANREQERKSNPAVQHDDLLELLLTAYDDELHTTMTSKQLRDEITTIFMAGHETTSQTLSWIFYRLALHPILYDKVRTEVLMQQANMNVEGLKNLTYTKALIEEAMRFYPPVWIMARKASEADDVNGYKLPTGATVLINVYGMHHHPGYWKDPHIFDPERFSKENKESIPPFLYLSFGGGQRLCIAYHFAMMVMQTVVARLVQHFSFSVIDGFEPTVDANLTLRAKEGIQLRIQKTTTHANS